MRRKLTYFCCFCRKRYTNSNWINVERSRHANELRGLSRVTKDELIPLKKSSRLICCASHVESLEESIRHGLRVVRLPSLEENAGDGLFAREDLEKNALLTMYGGRWMVKSNVDALIDKSRVASLNNAIVIDGAVGRQPGYLAGFTNARLPEDPVAPNAELYKDDVKNVIWLRTVIAVRKGEELFVRYGRRENAFIRQLRASPTSTSRRPRQHKLGGFSPVHVNYRVNRGAIKKRQQ